MSLYFLTPKACVCTNMAQMQSASGRTGKAEHFHESQLQISWLRGKKLPSEIQIYEGICTLISPKTSQVKKFICILKTIKNLGEI